MREPFKFGNFEIPPGSRKVCNLLLARLYTYTEISMPVQVIHGRKDGPRLFVCAALHGDEINGVEILRRLLRLKVLRRLRGTLVAIPIVNVHGFIHHSRCLPDRRDLNRSFPGSRKGSFAARLAHLFMTEVVEKCTHGIDLHTGSLHRANLPQIRTDLEDPGTTELAHAFRVPVILHSKHRDGSLRQAVYEKEIPMLVYEGGEALRFDEVAIRAGVKGILSVMRKIKMLPPKAPPEKSIDALLAKSSFWVRAPQSGILRARRLLGEKLNPHDALGSISDPLGSNEIDVRTPTSGILIGQVNLPLVNRGDAMFHIAVLEDSSAVAETLRRFQAEIDPDSEIEGVPYFSG